MRLRYLHLLLSSLLTLVISTAATAASFTVDGRATGRFGMFGAGIRDGLDMVLGDTISSG